MRPKKPCEDEEEAADVPEAAADWVDLRKMVLA